MSAVPNTQARERPRAPTRARTINLVRSLREKPATNRVGVVIGTFEPLFSDGLATALSSDRSFRVLTSEVQDDALSTVIEELSPDLAVFDEGVAFDEQRSRALVRAHPETHMVMLARPPARAHVVQLIGEGVTCLDRGERGERLAKAMLLAATAGPAELEGEFMVSMKRLAAVRSLTLRERQVLACLEERRSDSEIARSLVISVATVRRHRGAISRKLGVRERQDLLGVVKG